MRMANRMLAAFLCFLVISPAAALDESEEDGTEEKADTLKTLSLDEIASEMSHPASSLLMLHNDFEYRTFSGRLPEAGDQQQGMYRFTASMPFQLSNGKQIIVRGTLPMSTGTPTYITEDDDFAEWHIRKVADELPEDGYFISGHGHADDITYDIAYGGVSDSGFISMFGIAGAFPTSQDGSTERDLYLLGPQLALGQVTDWGVIGFWAKHLVDVWENTEKPIDWKTNETWLQVFFQYGLGNGWSVISNPEILYDWEGASDNRLYLPVGGGFSKTMRWGRVPWKMDLEIYNYIESPEAFGPEWQLTFTLTPAFRGF